MVPLVEAGVVVVQTVEEVAPVAVVVVVVAVAVVKLTPGVSATAASVPRSTRSLMSTPSVAAIRMLPRPATMSAQRKRLEKCITMLSLLKCSPAEHSRVTRCMHLYTDKCSPQGEKFACVAVWLFHPGTCAAAHSLQGIYTHFLRVGEVMQILPLHMGSHTPSSEDLYPFLEGGCSYARSLVIMAEDSRVPT